METQIICTAKALSPRHRKALAAPPRAIKQALAGPTHLVYLAHFENPDDTAHQEIILQTIANKEHGRFFASMVASVAASAKQHTTA